MFNSPQQILVNEYYPGQSFSDPILNETASYTSQVSVTCNKPAMLFYLTKPAYVQIFIDKLNEMQNARLKLVSENFSPFNSWEETRLKNLLMNARERVLNADECLIREQQAQPYIYLLVSGKLRVERKVKVESLNYWPDAATKDWVEKKVTSDVLFKVSEILPMKMFGERECIYEYANPV